MTMPERYLSFISSARNPDRRYWYIVENGNYRGGSGKTLDQVLSRLGEPAPFAAYDFRNDQWMKLKHTTVNGTVRVHLDTQ